MPRYSKGKSWKRNKRKLAKNPEAFIPKKVLDAIKRREVKRARARPEAAPRAVIYLSSYEGRSAAMMTPSRFADNYSAESCYLVEPDLVRFEDYIEESGSYLLLRLSGGLIREGGLETIANEIAGRPFMPVLVKGRVAANQLRGLLYTRGYDSRPIPERIRHKEPDHVSAYRPNAVTERSLYPHHRNSFGF